MNKAPICGKCVVDTTRQALEHLCGQCARTQDYTLMKIYNIHLGNYVPYLPMFTTKGGLIKMYRE